MDSAFSDEIICIGNDEDGITVYTSSPQVVEREEEMLDLFMDKWQVRGRLVTLKLIDEIPRNSSGKVMYSKL